MSLFKLFSKNKEQETQNNMFPDYVDCTSWFEVYSACLGKMMVIKSRCDDSFIKGQKWAADLKNGIIQFGDKTFPLQFIGSEGNKTNSWQWGYKNINSFPENILQLAMEMKNKGEEWGLEPLLVADFELNNVFNGETLSIVACSISDKPYSYYRAKTEKGAAYLAYSDLPEYILQPVDINKFVEITVECLQEYHVDHKIFVESFLLWNGTKYEIKGSDIIAHFPVDLKISFEEIDGMIRVDEITTI